MLDATRVWWLFLITGIVEIILGFWAAGDFGHKVILLVVWVGVAALIRGFLRSFSPSPSNA
jgi:uncharacterized membrane protein HdeD (DUF308 family)